jgi:two-component system chemotaxis response regulator CheB
MTREIEVIVIGGSAGALDALSAILPALPANFPIPVAMVLHVPPTRSYLAEVLGARTRLKVKEADDKEPLTAGTIFVAPPNYHLLIERDRRLALSVDEPVFFSRPSIDVLFESAADSCGPVLAGLLLTGANEDGARGLARIKAAGGTTLVQSPETSPMVVMPEAAIRLHRIDHVLPLAEIGPHLLELGRRRRAEERP